MGNNPNELWRRCLEIIHDNITQQQFDTWFAYINLKSFADKRLVLSVPSQFVYEFVEEHFLDLLKKTITKVFGTGVCLSYSILEDKQNGLTVEVESSNKSIVQNGTAVRKANLSPDVLMAPAVQDLDSQLRPNYNFENFLEGDSNKLARSVGEAIAQNPAKTFNPFFLFGHSGVGKTHLCHAIGRRIRELHPQKKVLYVTSHLFRVQFTDAIRKNTTNDFLNFYQNIDVLLLDDIQELIGMDKTQNTFFHIFNHLHQLGKQLILTSDKAPVDLQGMEERLITRLKWGLTAELSRPDLDLRKKILKNKINHDGIVIPDEVFNFIANNVTENVRDLEGILVSLMANAVINNREIDLSLTKRVVSQAVHLEKKQLSVQMIQETVCKYFNLEQATIQTNSRKREVVQARQITMYLSKKYTDSSFSSIGKIVGKRDHATVLHACKTIKDQIETNKSFRASVEEIEALLKN